MRDEAPAHQSQPQWSSRAGGANLVLTQREQDMTTHTDPTQFRTGGDCQTATEIQESWDRAVSEIREAVVGCLEGAQA